MRTPIAFSLLLVSSVATLAPPAGAFEDGDVCKLKTPLEITMRTSAGELKAQVERGTQVEVRAVGDTTVQVYAGESEGVVSAIDLEAACAGSLRLCRVRDPVVMRERTDGTGRAFRIKSGADLSVLRQGRTWGHVRIGDMEGYVKAADLDVSCLTEGGGKNVPATAVADPGLAIDRAEGPGVLVVPFYTAGTQVSTKVADAFSSALFDELGVYRPDAVLADEAVMATGRPPRVLPLRPAQDDAATRAKGIGLAYALTGRLERYGEGYVLAIVLIDAKTGKVLKAVKARPTVAPEDPWATGALAVLLTAAAPAPGSTVPKPPARPAPPAP